MSTIFGKIAGGEIPTDFVHEDQHCVAFRDISPQAPTHVLIIPRKPLKNLAAAGPADTALLGHLLEVAKTVARQEGLEEQGYRVVLNVGRHGGQTVDHLHLHLLGGRALGWPPG